MQYIISPFFLRIERTISVIRRNSPNAFEFFGCFVLLNVLKLILTRLILLCLYANQFGCFLDYSELNNYAYYKK